MIKNKGLINVMFVSANEMRLQLKFYERVSNLFVSTILNECVCEERISNKLSFSHKYVNLRILRVETYLHIRFYGDIFILTFDFACNE